MGLAPELRFLERVQWQVFVTLTFRGRVPCPDRRARWLRAWLSGVARRAQVPFCRLDWVVRDEAGEKFGRPHFHVLIGRIPSLLLSPALLFRLKADWRRVGFSDLRMWHEGLDALSYMSEDGGNCYEASKFCYATGLVLSESLLDMASTGDTGESAWRVEQSENPDSSKRLSDNAGLDQQSSLETVGGIFSFGVQWGKRFGLIPSWITAGRQLAAVNASDQGIVLHYQADVTGALKQATP